MMIDSHPPVPPTSAVFDPATLMRGKPMQNGQMTASQQQQARQRYWSGLPMGRPSSLNDATILNAAMAGSDPSAKKGKMQPQQQWNTPIEKDIYTPFKSASGRATPLDDPYSPPLRAALNGTGNEYMPAPQDPRDRPPSRATSVQGGMMGGFGPYGRRLERKSEGSVVYQPLTPTNHASAWSNSLMFNKPYGPGMDPFDTLHDMPLGASAAVPPLPHIQTLPRQLPLARNNMNGNGHPPEEPTHNPRQQIPQPFGYQPMNAQPDTNQFQKSDQNKSNGNRVTVVPNGTVIGSAESISSDDMDAEAGVESRDESDGKKGKRAKNRRRRSSKQRDANNSMEKSIPSHSAGSFHLKIVEKFAILHILLGITIFALGIARLLLMSVWGLGIELVYGVIVILMGILGIIGCRRRHYCSLAACYTMSALSCILGIVPFVTGLLVTIPDSFHSIEVDTKLFTSPHEPYAIDIALSVVCLVEILISIIVSGMGCSVIGRALSKWGNLNGNENEMIKNRAQQITAGLGNQQAPVFHTSVNITHPAMMK